MSAHDAFLRMTPRPAIVQAVGMRGFAAEFRDLDHYIRVITDRIWEGRDLDSIRDYYSDPCIVETPSSVSTSVQSVIDGTAATLAMFPDRRLLAEDVIQSGDENGGFLSSHRIISPMTHRGDGSFGKATGRKLHVRTIADCVCKDNRIIHEWLVRDVGAIALQIGTTPRQLAAQWLRDRGGWHKPVAGPAPAGYTSHISRADLAQRYAQMIEHVATQRGQAKPQVLADLYDDAVQQIAHGNQTRFGHQEVAAYWADLFSSLQAQSFVVEHLALQRGGGRPDRVALRWRASCEAVESAFSCTESGSSVPESRSLKKQFDSKQAIELMGICHAEFVNGCIVREWVLIDEVALWMQILAANGLTQ
jgi:predicted ester cyclase